MLDRGVEYMIKREGNSDFKFPFLKIADYFKKADILFGNLESIISDKGQKVGSIYSFRAKPEAIDGLVCADDYPLVSVRCAAHGQRCAPGRALIMGMCGQDGPAAMRAEAFPQG